MSFVGQTDGLCRPAVSTGQGDKLRNKRRCFALGVAFDQHSAC